VNEYNLTILTSVLLNYAMTFMWPVINQ